MKNQTCKNCEHEEEKHAKRTIKRFGLEPNCCNLCPCKKFKAEDEFIHRCPCDDCIGKEYPTKHEKPQKGLKIIDGTPTTISKLIRENEKPQKSKAGITITDVKVVNPESLKDAFKEKPQKGCGKKFCHECDKGCFTCGKLYLCSACENHSPSSCRHECVVGSNPTKDKGSEVSQRVERTSSGSFTNLSEKIELWKLRFGIAVSQSPKFKELDEIHKEFIRRLNDRKFFNTCKCESCKDREWVIDIKDIDKLAGKNLSGGD